MATLLFPVKRSGLLRTSSTCFLGHSLLFPDEGNLGGIGLRLCQRVVQASLALTDPPPGGA